MPPHSGFWRKVTSPETACFPAASPAPDASSISSPAQLYEVAVQQEQERERKRKQQAERAGGAAKPPACASAAALAAYAHFLFLTEGKEQFR